MCGCLKTLRDSVQELRNIFHDFYVFYIIFQ
ncbi:hypothetical protein AvCA_23900 [Azotobacter vinelandii CA]|uniref:Uncharacterized protein n=2 Tax=Azotobacter vinelandii TaxID=354 RepID=C1DHI2_AZOVD|nr:hypothetical protein Avin_23900 [Azotobacter vinelandii DJ]AGK14967.1 hypothetical protein AvCA_23900 [Azotobacter vinelandii CA]AGK20599.1 hypothetical protein AvCA6_23900 [Azotobacter vinelandii CA6]